MSRIAFIGLGNMGLPMALNLSRAGFAVIGHDLSPEACAALAPHAEIAATVAEAVQNADVIVTMLPAGRHVAEVYLGTNGVLAHVTGAPLLIDCSTIDVETARHVGAAASAQGLDMLDAPVSGGTGGATAGTLTFMVGGPETAFIRAGLVLAAMGKTIVHAGGSGAGQAAKICNNMILGISMLAVSEAFALADRLGLDHQKLFDVSSKSSGQCWALTSYCPVPGPVPASPANRDWQPGFSAALMSKDLSLSQAAAGPTTPLGALASAHYAKMVEEGHGDRDFSYAYPWLTDRAK